MFDKFNIEHYHDYQDHTRIPLHTIMGSSSSKAARKLPKAPPTWAGARTAGEFKYPEGVLPLGADKVQPPSRGPSGDSTKSPGGALDYGVIHPSGPGTEHATGRKNVHASEKKDDSECAVSNLFCSVISEHASPSDMTAIMRDGVDPDFMANLSRLGQVAVPKPGLSFEKVSGAATHRMLSDLMFPLTVVPTASTSFTYHVIAIIRLYINILRSSSKLSYRLDAVFSARQDQDGAPRPIRCKVMQRIQYHRSEIK